VLKVFGVAAALQMAALPVAGPVLAEAPVESIKKSAKQAQDAVPEGATNPLTREQRNTRNAKTTVGAFETIKDRANSDFIKANDNSGRQNIFAAGADRTRDTPNPFKQDNVSYSFPSTTAPQIVGDFAAVEPKQGGDLKDSLDSRAGAMSNGASNLTAGAVAGETGGRTGGAGDIKRSDTPTLPNALGGKNLLRVDNESPEEAAKRNIAEAREGKGSLVDTAKNALGF
jgi:hypothetical protein